MVERCDYYSDQEYEFAKQAECESYKEQLALEEEYARCLEDESKKLNIKGEENRE